MNWTKETPTKCGKYWLREPGRNAELVHVSVSLAGTDPMVWFYGIAASQQPDEGSEWWGPLPHPNEAPQWTRELPTQVGAYWARWKPGKAFTVNVSLHHGELRFPGLGKLEGLEWLGPLPEPQ